MTRITLIHAVTAAMQPVEDAFRAHWDETRRTNLFDDSLAADREQAGRLTPEMSARILSLARYALDSGANAILYTCSAFGAAIEAAANTLPVPILKPNEAMFEAALKIGGRIVMLATFAPAVASMEEEFRDMAQRSGSTAVLETVLVPEAREALVARELEKHDHLIAAAASKQTDCSAIVLAHFSMATAARRIEAHCPILAAPESAVLKLRSMLSGAVAA